MAEDTQAQIEARLAELPEDVREAVLSAQLGERLGAIGQKHSLHIDQVGKLEDETMLVMLGFFDPDQFNKQLEEQLSLSPADAAAIAQEVNTSVFMPIRESLKRFTEAKAAIPTPPSVPKEAQLPQVQTAPSPSVAPAPVPVTPPAPSMPAVEHMLTEKTVVKPIYKVDPYREPIE